MWQQAIRNVAIAHGDAHTPLCTATDICGFCALLQDPATGELTAMTCAMCDMTHHERCSAKFLQTTGGMPATNLLPGGEAVESGMCIKPDWFDKQTVCIFCEQFIDRAGL